MIEARIRKSFPGGKDSAPFDLDIQIETGARVAILFGPSGAGKTLTLDSIAGFVRPDAGRILVNDVLVFDAAAGANVPPQQRRCGYVFQNYALFPHMTLRENLMFAVSRVSGLEKHRRVNAMLDQFHLEEFAGRRPHELSGGQKQRGSIARALLSEPRLLLLDEPARGLDPALRAELYSLIAEVRERYQIQVLLVTHDLDEALELGEEMFVLDNGRIVQSGPPREIVDQPASAAVARLLGCFNIISAEILAMDPASNRSRLRCRLEGAAPFEIAGPYLPGHLLGAHVTLAARFDLLRAVPGRRSSIPLAVTRASHRANTLRLEFEGGLMVDTPHAAFDDNGIEREWSLELPASAIRVLKP
jgi:molybdate transport system ATP-binding protein